jgi:hypothetical protein
MIVSHLLDLSPTAFSELDVEVCALAEHPVFGQVQSVEALRTFMEHHVFAVWDFMSLLKALQAQLAPAHWPWRPRTHPHLVRLINEIVLTEESDVLPAHPCGIGGHASHFEIYVAAMDEVGADTSVIERFMELVSRRGVLFALGEAPVPPPAYEFVTDTFSLLRARRPHAIAAAFSFGRERAIPLMFRGLLDKLSIGADAAPLLYHYLRRHVDLDTAEHGPAAQALVSALCGSDSARLDEAHAAARMALASRRRFLDGIEMAIARNRMQTRVAEKLEAHPCL